MATQQPLEERKPSALERFAGYKAPIAHRKAAAFEQHLEVAGWVNCTWSSQQKKSAKRERP